MSCVVRTVRRVLRGGVKRFVNNIAITFVCVYVRLLLPSIFSPDRGQCVLLSCCFTVNTPCRFYGRDRVLRLSNTLMSRSRDKYVLCIPHVLRSVRVRSDGIFKASLLSAIASSAKGAKERRGAWSFTG